MESRPENMKVAAGFDILMGGGPSYRPPPKVEEQQASESKKVMNFQEEKIANGTMNEGFDIAGSQKYSGFNPVVQYS